MSKLIFDLRATQSEKKQVKFHGGGEYAKMVLKEALDAGYLNFECVYNGLLPIDNEIKLLCESKKINLIPIKNNKELQYLIESKGYTKLYSALPYHMGDLNLANCKFIMTIHGLRPLECIFDKTEWYYTTSIKSIVKYFARMIFSKVLFRIRYKEFKQLLSIKNKKVIVVSSHTKYSLLSLFPQQNSDEYIPIPAPLNTKSVEINKTSIKELNIKEKYFLLISANRWIKNNYRAIKALDVLFSEGRLKGIKIILIGISEANKRLLKINNKSSFLCSDYVESDDLEVLFKNAFAFIYPTLNEGYGLPPIKAMQYNVPVLASAVASVPEVCSNAALYFNPYSIEEIKNRILQITYDKKLYKKLQEKGLERFKELTSKEELNVHMRLKAIFE